MKITLPVLILFLLGYNLSAQTQRDYFQQEVNYRIKVSLDDETSELLGDESIEYINNSPDALPFLYFHIWPNAYKNNKTQLGKQLTENKEMLFYFADDKDRGFIDRLDFKVNGEKIKWEFAGDTIDICRLWLKTPLLPGERITISTPFHVKIPLGKFSRMGHIGQQYQVTQWYPKPAVYDRNGWNQFPYLDQGEFYSEFGTYDVYITLPQNYVVGATGDLVDGGEEEKFIQSKIAETKKWIEDFNLTGKENNSFPMSFNQTKTLHFHQEQVHDFAWFCDKRYHILQGEIETPHLKKKVITRALFTDGQAKYWIKSIPYINDAVSFYSLWNGDYPYNHVTAVDGALSAGGGMEYPNITVIGGTGSDISLETVIMHEVGHNWFYGILGSNERKNPWMDEGINSFNESRYIKTKYPDESLLGSDFIKEIARLFDLDVYKHKHEYYLAYLFNSKKEMDQPIQLAAPLYTLFNYEAIVYCKTAIAFNYLQAYLGETTMDAAMQEYFEKWKFKHPQPDDLRKIMENVSGKNLSWFFDDLIKTTKKLDYKIIASLPASGGGYDVLVKNVGQIKGPVALCGIKNNKLKGVVWFDGFSNAEILGFPPVADGIDYFMIDYNGDMPEINRNNNILYTRGVFKKLEPLKLQFLGSLDRPDRTQLFGTPVIGWNNYNRFMFGAAFYNTVIPQKRIEFLFIPMFAAGTESLTGFGNITLNLPLQNTFLQQISVGLTGSRYAYNDVPFPMHFNRIVPELNFKFRKIRARSPVTQNIRLRSVFILRENYSEILSGNSYITSRMMDTILIHNVTYSAVCSRKLNPWDLTFDFQQGQKMSKISAQANYEISFDKNKSIDIRLFGGYFISSDNNPTYAFRMSGETGTQDYLYDRTYFGRSERTGILSNQFTETDGGFKVYSPWGQTTRWLTSLNIKSSIPYLPRILRLYADIGICEKSSLLAGTNVLYNAGINISLWKNIFEIYFPLFMSQEIHDYLYLYRGFQYPETVRFTMNLNLVNPFGIIKNLTL